MKDGDERTSPSSDGSGNTKGKTYFISYSYMENDTNESEYYLRLFPQTVANQAVTNMDILQQGQSTVNHFNIAILV